MRSSDIEIGGEYAYGAWGQLSKVRIIEKGLKDVGGRRMRVRFEHVAGAPLHGDTGSTRDIEPWSSRHDARFAREARQAEREQRVGRVADRLGIVATANYGNRVVIHDDRDFYSLAQRLGVAID